jgi:hypothetical protein
MMLQLAFGDEPAEEYDIANMYMTDSDTIRIELCEREADKLTFEDQTKRNSEGQKR